MGKSRKNATGAGRCGVKLVRGPFVKLPVHADHCSDVPSLMRLLRRTDSPTAIDLFCGAGGLSLGLKDAGFEVVMGVDHDKEAIETHASLCPGLSVSWDLSDETVVEQVAEIVSKGKISLVAGGPPCQPFSNAGKALIRHLVASGRRHRNDQRRELWQSFLSIVEKALPPAVLMENVPEIALDPDMTILRAMVAKLESLGYSVSTKLLETWRFGVPQFRERFFLVALRDGTPFQWPPESSERVTVGNAISDLPAVEGGARPDGGPEGWWAYDGPSSRFQRRARTHIGKSKRGRIYDHITRPVRDDDRVVFSQMDSKTRYTDIPAEFKRYRDDIFTDKYKRLDANDLSRTITAHIAKDGYWYIHPSQPRTLTVREAARIQTFRDDVRFSGPPSSAFRQIGNAVPPVMAEHLGIAIKSSLDARKGKRRQVSTEVIAESIATWFRGQGASVSPWFREATAWQVLLAEMLFARVRASVVRQAWPAISGFRTPKLTLRGRCDLEEVAGYLGRAKTAAQILDAAEWFAKNPKALKSFEGMKSAPHIDDAAAAIANWAGGGSNEGPVAIIAATLRPSARVCGDAVDKRNHSSDGRIAVARMIGADENTRDAFLGLLHIGRTVCTPSEPRCHECPLAGLCVKGASQVRLRPTLFG
jgi:DNA (cytosine-5)-methyltransferase 1